MKKSDSLWFVAILLPATFWAQHNRLKQNNKATPQINTRKLTRIVPAAKLPVTSRIVSLPDEFATESLPYLCSWKDASHLWVLKQTEPTYALKLWNVATGEYKTVSRFKKGSIKVFKPKTYYDVANYSQENRQLVLVTGKKPGPVGIGTKAQVWMRDSYLLQTEPTDHTDSEVLQVSIWDVKKAVKKKPLLIPSPPGRFLTFNTEPGTDHNMGVGPSIDLNFRMGLGVIASFDSADPYSMGKDQLDIFKIQTGQYLRRIKLEAVDVKDVLMTPDGKKVVVIGEIVLKEHGEWGVRGLLQVWDVKTGKMLWRYITKEIYHGVAVISADSRKVAADLILPNWADEGIGVWDLSSGKLQSKSLPIRNPAKSPISLLFSPDSRHLAMSERDGYVSVWRFK